MSELFSEEWMQGYKEKWNAEPEVSEALAAISFSSCIGYGFKGDSQPKGVLVIENGKAVLGSSYNGESLDWDLRADIEDWKKWLTKGLNLMSLGMAYTTRKLKFEQGDYGAMIKDPRMAGPFIKSFSVMGKV